MKILTTLKKEKKKKRIHPIIIIGFLVVLFSPTAPQTWTLAYRHREETAQADNDENIEDGRSHNCTHSHVALRDEHAWEKKGKKRKKRNKTNVTLAA